MFLSIASKAKEIQFKLEKNQKIKSTFSGDINQESSIHLIIFRNKKTKNYGIKPFYIDKDQKTKEFEIIDFEKEIPEIVSYHQNNNTISLIIERNLFDAKVEINVKSRKKLTIIDLNISDKKTALKNLDLKHLNNNKYFHVSDKTFVLHYKGEKLFINTIKNSQKIDSTKIKFQAEDLKISKKFFDGSIEFVNTQEYVKNGSIANVKAYHQDEKLFFTHFENKKDGITSTFIDLNQNQPLVFYKNGLSEEYKKTWSRTASYIHNGDLFLFCRNPSDMFLEIIDVYTGKSKYRASLKKGFSSYLDQKKLDLLQQKLSWNTNKPTITVNKSIDQNLVIRFDYVKPENYRYDNMWWFHQQMWQHQQMMNNIPKINTSRFGPTPTYFDERLLFFKSKKKELFQEIVMDTNYSLIENGRKETLRKKIDKEQYFKKLNKNRDFKYTSAAFLSDDIRYIFYSKTSKAIFIKTGEYR